MNRTRLLTTMAVLIAMGTLTSQLVWFPAGIARAYPVQHAINIVAAVTLGPGPAVIIAFMISLLRNLLGLGTLLAFPGSMIGAFLAAYFYRMSGKHALAALGEGIGSGFIGALFAVPFAYIFMGNSVGALAFVPPFIVSSTTGAIIGMFIVSRMKIKNIIRI